MTCRQWAISQPFNRKERLTCGNRVNLEGSVLRATSHSHTDKTGTIQTGSGVGVARGGAEKRKLSDECPSALEDVTQESRRSAVGQREGTEHD